MPVFGQQCHTSRTVVLLVTVLYLTKMSKSRPSMIPTIMDNPETVTHLEGEMAVLYCSVLNLGDSTVTWRKLPSSSPLTIGTKSWVRDVRVHAEHMPYSSQWNLVIEQVRVDDAGEYECHVNKRFSQLRHKVTLVVKEKPAALLPRIEISGQNVLKIGSLLQLTCTAILVDIAVDTVTWTKDGVPVLQGKDNRYGLHTSLTPSGQNSGVVRSILEVKDTRSDDSGIYICRSSERVQMAGVNVEIQGTHNLKRADMKLEVSKGHSEVAHFGHSKATSSLHQDHASLHCRVFIVLTICVMFSAGFIT